MATLVEARFQAALFRPCSDQGLMSSSSLSESHGQTDGGYGKDNAASSSSRGALAPHAFHCDPRPVGLASPPLARPFRPAKLRPLQGCSFFHLPPKPNLQQKARANCGLLMGRDMVNAPGLLEPAFGSLRGPVFSSQSGVEICPCFPRRELSIDSSVSAKAWS